MNEKTDSGCGFQIAFMLLLLLVSTIIVALAWNVGLYGAGIVDHKIGFWTAFGLNYVIVILRSIFARDAATMISNHFQRKNADNE